MSLGINPKYLCKKLRPLAVQKLVIYNIQILCSSLVCRKFNSFSTVQLFLKLCHKNAVDKAQFTGGSTICIHVYRESCGKLHIKDLTEDRHHVTL